MSTTGVFVPILRRFAAAAAAAACCAGCAVSPALTGRTDPSVALNSSAAKPGGATTPTPGSTPGMSSTGSPAPGRLELPRGGRRVFPRYRLVGYAGLTGASTLGRLGTGPLDQRVGELEKRAAAYGHGREILPVMEVIATIVQGSPGADGLYRIRIKDSQIATYLAAARRHHALLLLNIQPGRSEFLPEVKAYARWLREPDVGVALDPEWAMDPGQVPGRAYGHTTGRELDAVGAYLASLVRDSSLPEKVMVYHQVARSVVHSESDLWPHPGVVMIKSVDGLGPSAEKITTYRAVNQTTPKFVHAGFKLFFSEDTRNGAALMSPSDVLALRPRPEYVMYE